MKLNTAWLRDFCKVELTATEIAEALTHSCVVAEGLSDPYAHLDKVLVAKLLKAKPLTGSDHLFRCEVNHGSGTAIVVAGAPNSLEAVDKLVAWVPPGTELPFGKVEQRELFGVESEGMLASEEELGLSADHSGLLVLEEGTIGQPLRELYELDNARVIDFETTPNRPDTLSQLGLGRQLAALKQVEFHPPESDLKLKVRDDEERVRIDCPELCRRYVGVIVRGVKVGPSPAWLARRLASIGHRPISNVVDVTNYVLHGLGQPLHTFDLAKLAGERIIVRQAEPGEKLLALDEVEYKLKPEMMVIADEQKPVAVAGVMGGLESGVSAETVDILIESAWFDPTSVRATSNALGLTSSSQQLFVRGADQNLAPLAARYAAELIVQLAGGEVEPILYDCEPEQYKSPEVSLRWQRAKDILGFAIEPKEGKRVLKALGCELLVDTEGVTGWYTPAHRPDLNREVDLIEELAQVLGYDRVPAEMPLLRAANLNKPNPERLIHQTLATAGVNEVLLTDFVSAEEAAGFGFAEEQLVAVRNPLDKGHPYLRPSDFIGLLNAASYNNRQGAEELCFYEVATLFSKGEPTPLERRFLSLILVGKRPGDSWHKADRPLDFYDLKGIFTALGEALRIRSLRLKPTEPGTGMNFELAILSGEERLGRLVGFDEELLSQYDLEDKPAWGLEMELAPLLALVGEPEFHELPAYPPATRDLAMIFDKETPHAEIVKLIRERGGEPLVDVKLFDLYEGKQVGGGKRSLAYALTYRSAARTLTDEEIETVQQEIITALEKEFEAKLRM